MSDSSKPDYAALGGAGGRMKAANIATKLQSAAATMPPLDSEQHAMERLATINDLSVSGVLPGSQAGAAVRSVEVWLRVREAEVDRNRIRQLEQTIERLEKQLAARSARRVG